MLGVADLRPPIVVGEHERGAQRLPWSELDSDRSHRSSLASGRPGTGPDAAREHGHAVSAGSLVDATQLVSEARERELRLEWGGVMCDDGVAPALVLQRLVQLRPPLRIEEDPPPRYLASTARDERGISSGPALPIERRYVGAKLVGLDAPGRAGSRC